LEVPLFTSVSGAERGDLGGSNQTLGSSESYVHLVALGGRGI